MKISANSVNLILLFVYCAFGCKNRFESKSSTVEVKSSESQRELDAKYDYLRHGPDKPPLGRSMFDLIISDRSAPAGYSIPWPFEDLLAKIGSDGSGFSSALIPKGRSLQRDAAAPDYFEFPRVILSALSR